MAVSWLVLPIVPEIIDWLQNQHGLTVPNVESRWATLDELLEILASIGESVSRKDIPHRDGNVVSLIMGKIDTPAFAQISGRIKGDHFEFSFENNGNTPQIMLTILTKLCVTCGALVIFCGTGGAPYIVTADTDIDEAIRTGDFY